LNIRILDLFRICDFEFGALEIEELEID